MLLNIPCTLIWVSPMQTYEVSILIFICKRHTICKLHVAFFFKLHVAGSKGKLINKPHCNNQRDQSPFIHMHVII